jgi:hypothetical protein
MHIHTYHLPLSLLLSLLCYRLVILISYSTPMLLSFMSFMSFMSVMRIAYGIGGE